MELIKIKMNFFKLFFSFFVAAAVASSEDGKDFKPKKIHFSDVVEFVEDYIRIT